MKGAKSVAIYVMLLILTPSALVAWTTVGVGIEYQEFTLPDPNRLFVARMDRSNPNATIETCWAAGNFSTGAHERITEQSARLDDAINWWGQSWGQRNDVIVAINGDFIITNPPPDPGKDVVGSVVQGQCHSGWYAKRHRNMTGGSGFGWSVFRNAFIGGCVNHRADKQVVSYTATGQTQRLNGVNVPREANELILYTPQYDSTTRTDNSGVEVLVEMTRPSILIAYPYSAKGYVREIRQNQGSTPIPFDHVVLSATGSAAATLLANVSIGAEIGISQEITDYQSNCSTPTGFDWSKTYASIGGGKVFLKAGVVQDTGDNNLHPRTAIAYNDNYVFFVVCDGRSAISRGMTLTELGNFCKNTLGATYGINQDGGGSSVMVVNGVIKNVPSDGQERAVSNGIMMVNLLPKLQSSTFTTGQAVMTTSATSVRLGPGTNYPALLTVNAGTSGTILEHSLKGIYAKGSYWWKVSFAVGTGWVAQTALTAASPPSAPADGAPIANSSSNITWRWSDVLGESGYRVKDLSGVTKSGDLGPDTTEWTESTGLVPNTQYSRRIYAFNAYGESAGSSGQAKYTLAKAGESTDGSGTTGNVWCENAKKNTCYGPDKTFVFVNPAGFGTGGTWKASRFEYKWNRNAIEDWTTAGTDWSSGAISLGAAFGAGDYYLHVRAFNGDGVANNSEKLDYGPFRVALDVGHISALWPLSDSTPVSLRNKTVTAALAGSFWIEEQDRSAALRVISSENVERGDFVCLAGVLGRSGAQRALFAESVDHCGGGAEIAPLGMLQRSLGGSDASSSTPGVTGCNSTYNIGLLVRCAGQITYFSNGDPNARYFYFDDGSGLSSSGHRGVKVLCGSTNPPTAGMVVVTGVVGSEQDGPNIVPVILIRDASDIHAL